MIISQVKYSQRIGIFVLGVVSISIVDRAQAVPIAFSSAGGNAAAIQATVDSFRANLGNLNPNIAGSFGTGRREINWDGVPNTLAAPNNLPANFFNSNSPRGAVFSTPGTGFQVSANDGIAPIEFGNINPGYPELFGTFSAQRLFTALGSNIVDVNFFVPGSSIPALTRGFGSVFTDVDLANVSSIQYFDASNASLGSFFVPRFEGNQTLSFLGVAFDTAVISRVRITSGNQALSASTTTGDVVAMDDFIYAEPSVPEPSTLSIFGLGAVCTLAVSRQRRRR